MIISIVVRILMCVLGCPVIMSPLTQSRDEEQVLDPMSHRISQRQVDEGLDVEMVHQRQPGVVLGLQRV